MNVSYSGFGSDIICDASKTTTGIGKYNPPGGVDLPIFLIQLFYSLKLQTPTSLSADQTKFTKTLAHEYKHIEFPINNKLEYLKWAVIRDTNEINKKYDLKDGLGSNCHCSAGPAHECHNPENEAVCNEESRY